MNSTKVYENYYDILGLAETCSSKEIEESFRRLEARLRANRDGLPLLRRNHDLIRAYIALSDPAKRREYDKQLAAQRAAQQFRASSRESVLWPDGLPPWAIPDPGRPYTPPSPKRPLPPPPETDADPSLFAGIVALVLMFVLPVVFIHYYDLWLRGISSIVCGFSGGIGLWAFLIAPVAIAARIFATVGFFGGAALIAADDRPARVVGYVSAAAFGFFNTTAVASLVMWGHI